ncbi:astacin (peptidase family M12A) [Williamsia limnetica]|uniref:Astacin (Peptidase family M12A) n=1 Tax=Williamsia limnetica TaxID=882452 RepID=A0A318S1W7_WILLI|nr:M12 family metallopeptidase [Williamsia limnetica]PYE17398.1 astacin (peptidase family M12A) [Williamsia limnetica]
MTTNDDHCRIMSLPSRLHQRAAELAVTINPVNAPLQEPLSGTNIHVDAPLMLTVTTGKYWGPRPRRLTVGFMEPTPDDLRKRIVSHMNAWTATAGISFALTSGVGDVRISRERGGYYSYLGTDIGLIPLNRQTMNLEAFTMNTSEAEFRRVVRHETGHTLGFPHEHMRRALVERIDPAKAYAYFQRTQRWSKEMVDQQVLTSLNEKNIIGTPPDQDSIMCYQLPGVITTDGMPIRGGIDINATDFEFAGKIYPKLFADADSPAAHTTIADLENDWDPSEDVLVGAT